MYRTRNRFTTQTRDADEPLPVRRELEVEDLQWANVYAGFYLLSFSGLRQNTIREERCRS